MCGDVPIHVRASLAPRGGNTHAAAEYTNLQLGTLTAEWGLRDFHLSSGHSTSTWGIRDAGAKKKRKKQHVWGSSVGPI